MPLPCPQSISEAEYRALPEKERLAYIATDKKVRRVRLRAAAVRLTWVGEEPPPPLQGALKGGSQAASGSSPFGADSAPPEVRFPVGSTVNVVGYGEAIVEEHVEHGARAGTIRVRYTDGSGQQTAFQGESASV